MRFSARSSGGAIAAMLIVAATVAATQSQQPKPSAKKPAPHRVNELTLAGLRPGRDNLNQATALYKRYDCNQLQPGKQTVCLDACKDLSLNIDSDPRGKIQVIRVGGYCCSTVDCASGPPSPWKTGLGLRAGDPSAKVVHLYGEPDSRSPSTRDGQPLELLYYAFDWAGANVPQVMEVLCTKENNGTPGRVIEITLAAPSL